MNTKALKFCCRPVLEGEEENVLIFAKMSYNYPPGHPVSISFQEIAINKTVHILGVPKDVPNFHTQF